MQDKTGDFFSQRLQSSTVRSNLPPYGLSRIWVSVPHHFDTILTVCILSLQNRTYDTKFL